VGRKGQSLIIRADADVAIGTGHVMRCLALAQAWKDSGGQVLLLSHQLPGSIEGRFRSEGFQVLAVAAEPGGAEDARQTATASRELGASWTAVDGDRFGADFLLHLKQAGSRILLVDDFARREKIPADLIVNPNPTARNESYGGRGNGKLLLGIPYTLLRREFLEAEKKSTVATVARKVLISMGGSDPDDLTLRSGRALEAESRFELTAIVGPSYPNVERLKQKLTRTAVVNDPPNLPEIMSRCDIAVIAAGGTLWELLSLGCPVVSYGRNFVQADVVSELGRKGAVIDMGRADRFNAEGLARAVVALAESAEERGRMSRAGQKLVDGGGAERVCRALLTDRVEA
jgi:UDP-2,4-diacetamido-2,4,6-trideoxy-beta-L-altropyranose hydrolase